MTLVCPSCQLPLDCSDARWICRTEDLQFHETSGVPDFILPCRRKHVDEFLSLYQQIRDREQWGDDRPEYYRALPYTDMSGIHPHIWKLRSNTFNQLLADLNDEFGGKRLDILDLGAGNCWLSLRLVQLGHAVTASDANLSDTDGLGVLARICDEQLRVKCVRAEFDALPFARESFDVIVFGASLHYSSEPAQTLRRALALLKPSGSLYVLDSPVYANPESGRLMIQERLREWKEKYGIAVPAEHAGSFLTYGRLDQLGSVASISYHFPHFGIAWRIRPLIATLLRRRSPAQFPIVKFRPKRAGEVNH